MGRRNPEAPSWEAIQRSLDTFQPERIAAVLREYLTPRVPVGVHQLDEGLRQELREGVTALLDAHLGPWYQQSGTRWGDMVISGWTWQGGFFKPNRFAELAVEPNIQSLLKALGQEHAWLSRLDATFRSVELLDDKDPEIRRMALSDAVVKVLELTVEATGSEDDWYRYAFDAVEWLFEATGQRVTSKVRSAMNKTLGAFESWMGATPDEARAAGDALALAAVLPDFDARYPREE